MTLFFALASLGLPGLGNFVGEVLVLVGTYQASPLFTIPAVLGLVLAAVYSLSMIQRAFFGPDKERWTLPDLSLRETAITGVMIASLIWLGLHPQPVLNTSMSAITTILKTQAGQRVADQPAAALRAQDLGN